MTDQNFLNEKSGVVLGNENLSIEHNVKSNRRHISYKLEKLKVKKVDRTKREGTDNVAEEKFFLLFQTDIYVGNIIIPVCNFCFVKLMKKNLNNSIT